MPFGVRIDSVQISDRSVVEVLPTGVTAFVGPNNAGKSQLLREIQSNFRDQSPTVVTTALTIQRDGTQEELHDWLSIAAARRFANGTEHFYSEGQSAAVAHAYGWFTAGPPMGSNMANFFVRLLDAESRLSLASPVASFNVLNEPPTATLHRVFMDPDLETVLSDSFREAFGTGVLINRLGGSQISLHLGEPISSVIGEPGAYLTAIETRPQVSRQGDGMRSYLGILLAALGSPWPVLMIDEPEAFLHPPQARALGRQLAEIAANSRQVIVATHSADVIRGLLDGPSGSTAIHRLTRDGDVNHVSSLPATELQVMWSDPLLRFSNIIDGLFHTAVVLCESDSDCRFYEAVLSSLVHAGELAPHDWLFVHCGGKHRMPSVVTALVAAGVPVKVIADIDILRESEPLLTLANLVGVPHGAMDTALNALRAGVNSQSPQDPVGYVREKLDALFDAHEGSTMTVAMRDAVREATKSADGWSNFKRGGTSSLPQGEATTSCQYILNELATAGIHVVPVGELERWDPAITGHGPGWATDALSHGSHNVPGSPVWNFVKAIAQTGTA